VALKHPWVRGVSLPQSEIRNIVSQLKSYRAKKKFIKVVGAVKAMIRLQALTQGRMKQ
jgi:hypothetical protein